MSGVSDIFIYCGAHTDAVEEYIADSKWNPVTSAVSPFSTLEILKSAARSVGDALRDIDNRGLITGDFLLVHGDVISNLPIDSALAAHRARRTADKNAIMTLLLREGGLESHRTKAQIVTPVFVTDPTKARCLHYEEMHPLQANKYVNVDPTLLEEHSDIEIRTDLIDCGIDICTPDVLALWSESFDYEIPRRHFLHGVLKDYELNGKTIHMEIIKDHYAARASNLQAYDAISKDVLGRWTYPLVPDSNLMRGQSYKLSRGGICLEEGVVLARTCKIGKKTVLGKETSIGEGSTISNSIIGRYCVIGKNVKIENSYIWDNAVIGDNTEVQHAIIANEAFIGKNCFVKNGSLISFGVQISDNTVVKEGSRITRAKRDRRDSSGASLSERPRDESIVGRKGQGYAFTESDESEDEEEVKLQSGLIYNLSHLNISSESISTITSDITADDSTTPRSRLSSFVSVSDEGDDDVLGGGKSSTGEQFHKDAVADVFKTLSEDGDFSNTRVEFTSLRLSNNATDHHVRRAIAVAFTKRIASLVESGLEPSKAVANTLGKSGATAFMNDVAIGRDKDLAEQVDFLVSAQKDLVHRVKGDVVLFALCKDLYEREVIEEEGFEAWWGDVRSSETEEMRVVRERTKAFIEWLAEAEEEDSDEEEDDE